MDKTELMELTRRFPTPFYLFDGEALERRVAHLREVLPRDTALCYAVKANPFLAREVSALVERLEICSPGEYAICRQLGLEPSQYVISGVYKDPQWMEELASREDVEKMICTVESMAQYHLLWLTSGNQFGLNPQEIEEILSLYREDKFLELRGIQYFSGTQKTSVKRLGRELRMLEEFLSSLQDQYGPIPELELGPGFPVSYFADDAEQDEEVLLQAVQQLAQLSFPGKLTLELGRSIAASCGTYVTRVVDRKTNQSQNYAIVDGGIHQLVYFGQSMAMRRPQVELLPPRDGDGVENWNICGSLCTVNDILVKQLPLSRLEVGDVLAFGNAGAYCMTEGIALFLSRDLPGVVLCTPDGRAVLARDHLATHPLNTPNHQKEWNLWKD